MKVKELQKYLNSFNPEAKVVVGSDEELNTIYYGFEVAVLKDSDMADREDQVVIYGLSGQEELSYL